MAPQRASLRTVVSKQNKGSSHRHHSASEQRKPSARLNPLSIHFNREKVKAANSETEPPRETHFILKQFELSASDLSSESSLIETPRSSEQASSSISTSTLTDVVHYSKRRRLQTEVDTFDSYSSHHRHSHFTSCAPGLEEFFGLDHQKYPRDHIFQNFEQSSARPSLETILPTEFPYRGKTGSCNSKRLRGKGYVGGSSTEDIFSDQNQQADAGLFSSTAHQKDIEMPADQGEQTQKTPVTKVSIRGSRGQEDTDAPGGSGGSSWFRSFTCFADNDENEQVAIDLSGGSNQVSKTNPHASVSTPSGPPGAYLPDGLVFSNPVPSAGLHDPPGSSACSGGILRCVSSLSASISSSASSRLRPHRGQPSGRHDSSKRSIPGPSGGRSAGRASQTSSGNGVYIQHHHHHHAQTSTEQQQQPQHQQQQGSGINYRILQLKLAFGDVASQLVLLQEINQALLMGSDESLAGLAVHDLVSAIVDLLDSEKSLASLPDEEVVELKNLSCNILAHLMDVMPKAADAVVMAVPLLLNTMSCSFVGDILERIINVLEQVSRRNGRQVLLYGGVTTVMGYYDFVTVAQHRTILSMVANCFADVRRDDFFTHIAGCLPSLCERLACEGPGSSTEPRCVERVCLCFARLIEAFKGEPEKLREIASFGLCQHLKHLMTASPPIVSNMKDIAYMLATLCTYCPDLAVDILTMGYAETIYTLLTDQKPHEMTFHLPGPKTHMTGPRCTSSRTNIARCLENRGVENVYAIIHLISEMLPPIQDNGVILCPPTIFTSRTSTSTAKTDVRTVLFQQQCKAFEDIVSRGKRKTIVDDSEKTRGDADANAGFSKSNNLVLVRTVHLLLPMLLDLYTELNSTAPRMKCIEAIRRIVYNASPFVLSWMVSPRSVSAMVADMLGSPEFALIAAGLQLANLFITRIPQVFAIYFRKEGVLFHLQRLSSLASENNEKEDGSGAEESEAPSSSEANKQVLFTPLTSTLQARPTISSASLAPPQHPRSSSHWISGVSPTLSSAVADQSASSRLRLRSQRNSHRSTMEGSSCPKPPHFIFVPGFPGPNICDMNVLEPLAQAAPESSISSSSSSSSTLDIDLNAEAAQASPSATATSDVAGSCHDSNLRAWITGQCQDLYDRIKALVGNPPRPDTLASKALAGSGSGAVGNRKAMRRHSSSFPTLQTPQGVIPRDLVPELEALSHQLMAADEPAAWVTGLTRLASLLTQTILSEDEAPSPFEVQQSGLLDSLHVFLTQPTERRLRLFLLLRLFVGPQYTENINLKKIVEKPKILAQAKSALQSLKHQNNERSVYELAFPMLITCLLDCLHQQEHFQVVTGPTSLANAEACAEEALVLVDQGSGGSNASQVETRHRRSGAMSNRRVGSGGEGGGPSHSPCDQPPLRPLPRRWATLVPGFLKLELVRQVDEPLSTATTTATSSSLSRKTTAEGETSGKGTFWENAPTTLPIHANALITISNLQRLLIQRSFIASIMCGPEDHRDIRSIGEENVGLPFTHPTSQHIPHRRRFYRRHELPASPSEDPTSSKTRSVHYAAFDNSRHEKAPAHLSPGSQPHEALNLSLDHDADADKASTSKSREASRPKSMSLLAAFGMLQFASSSTSPPSSMAAAAAPAFSSQPPVLPETVSNVLHSHGRPGVRKDYSHSQQTHPHQPHPTSNRHQRQHQHQHHPSAHPALAASCVVGDLFENATLGGGGMHALVPVIYVGGTRVPDRMPLYQAIRAFSMDVNEQSRQLLADHRFSMTEQNREDRINAFMWRHIHTVHYRLEKATVSAVSSSSTTSFADSPTVLLSPASLFLRGVTSGISGGILAPSSASAPSTPTANVNSSTTTSTASSTNTKHSPTSSLSAAISCLKRPRRLDEMSNLPTQSMGKSPSSRLLTFLEPFTDFYAISNGYMAPTLFLLRALYGLCEVGNTLDDLIEPFPIIPADHFQSPKLSAKASRQLQDVFCVLAGNLPSWLVQIITTCPFLFPFSVRQNFFYVHNFDRDRTILHLQDSILNGSMDNETPGGGNGSGGGGGGGVNAGIGGAGHSSSPLPRLPHYYHSYGAFRLGGFDGGANSATAILESLLMESASQVQRHKITVHRDPKRLLRAAESALNELHDSRSILEIAFEGEVGFGLGPTLEFYTLVSHQLMTASLNLWHGHNYTDEGYIIAPAPGLYPRPLAKNLRSAQSREVRAKFFFLGQLMARSLLDWRQLDLSLSPTLFKWFLYTQSPEEDLVLCSPRVGVTAADLALVDPPFAKHFQSLLKMSRRRQELLEGSKTAVMAAEEEVRAIDMEIDYLYLSFVLPGYQIELCRGGSQIAVTGSNLAEYLHLCANWFLVEGARRQVIALIEGFDSVLPGIRTGKLATLFRPDECEGLFCGSGGFGGLYRDQLALLRTSSLVSSMPSFVTATKSASPSSSAVAAGWDVDTLMKSCLCDHGYTLQSKAIQYLFEIMSEFDEPRRRLFIQFATGSPRLPIGGFRALKPPLKIVMKREAEERADQHLPSVMTCQNYLKLPNYSTKEIMREKLLYAIYEGQHAFHLS